jgi:RNA polymerase sigma-70 factor (ECF subfamily)
MAQLADDLRPIQEALSGRPEAFGELFQRYQRRLVTSLVYLTGNHHLAEDIAQEAFVKAFLHLSQFRQSSAFYSWLYRIALNELSSFRRRRREQTLANLDQASLHMVDRQETGSDRLERKERIEFLRQALQRLSEEHRQIIVLREIDGCDYQGIADILEITLGTVRSRLYRAREQLQMLLAAERENS